jgi:anhydro-N-acetylmuramic acid kinase
LKIIGLMSGTSADGIDAALVDVSGDPDQLVWETKAFVEVAYPQSVRQAILELCDVKTARVDTICAMNVALGEWFADAALAVCQKAGLAPKDIDAIGSHGQTIHHLPNEMMVAERAVRATLQIGEPAVIAERTGITTVSNFRARDMAVGGQGAPLVPLVDYMLFRSQACGRVLLNIGGIANVTVLPKACEMDAVFAFDTGPGNMVIDGVVQHVTQGMLNYDKDGQIAQNGKPIHDVLSHFMRHPYFLKQPPKSTGRELFGQNVVKELIAKSDRAEDLVATATAWTAQSIAEALSRFVKPVCQIDEVIVSGGGAKNPVLMAFLAEFLGMQVKTSDDLGLQIEAKEAVAFALLAYETLCRRPGNVPRVTGASKSVVLGSVTMGHRPSNI